MNSVNAIAKVRFATVRPQRLQLHKGGGLVVDLLCMEAGQEISVDAGQWTYYVLTGAASVTCGGQSFQLSVGGLACSEPAETHTLANTGEERLVILATGKPA